MERKRSRKLRVFVAEPHPLMAKMLRYILEKEGCQIVMEAHTSLEAINLIPELAEKQIDIAVIDGFYQPHSGEMTEGKIIAKTLKEAMPEVKIIAFSVIKPDFGDTRLHKDAPTGIKNLIQAIKEYRRNTMT